MGFSGLFTRHKDDGENSNGKTVFILPLKLNPRSEYFNIESLFDDISLVLHARNMIYFITSLQNVNYYSVTW